MPASRGRVAEADAHFRKALEINPDYADARNNLGSLLVAIGKIDEGIAQWETLIRLQPKSVRALNQLAWLLATSPEASVRNGPRAVELAQQALRLAGSREPAVLGTLAAAYAEAGQFSKAAETAQQAVELAASQNNAALADALRANQTLPKQFSLSRTQATVASSVRAPLARCPMANLHFSPCCATAWPSSGTPLSVFPAW